MRWSTNPKFMQRAKDVLIWIRLAIVLLSIPPYFTVPLIAAETSPRLEHRSITVAIDDQYPPYIFRDSQGQLQGILVDTWALWSKKTGIAVKLEAMDWSKAQQVMLSGDADVIDTLFFTDARARFYDFSKPYATLEVPIFFHKTIGGITDARSLQGFTVGVKEGDACIDWLSSYGVANLQTYPSYQAIIDSAANNLVRVFCMDKPPALYFLNKKRLEAEFRYAAPLYTGQFHWATRKGDGVLHQIVAHGFERISEQERMSIEYKWAGWPVERAFDAEHMRRVVYATMLAALAIVTTLLWNWTLRRRVAASTVALTRSLDDLRASQEHFEALVSTTTVGVFETDRDGAWVYVNARWLEISGLSYHQTLGYGWVNALHPDVREGVLLKWEDAVRRQCPCALEFRMTGANGQHRWILGQAAPVTDAQGMISAYIGSMTDITERKVAEAQVEFMAYHDPLTELPNLVLLKNQVRVAIAVAERDNVKAALLFLDLDKFKAVNDSLGHPIGDGLIKAVAERLLDCVRSTDTVCRLGGDEFLILLFDVADVLRISDTLERIFERLTHTFDIAGQELSTTASVGIAVFPDDGRDFDTLLRNADIAMYNAKEAGRNTYCFYTERMNLNALENLHMRNSLQRALERGEFVLYYQPQIDIHSGRVIGVEALIRWRHPERGLVSPAAFIPVAEDSGLIVEIGEWVLRAACRQGVAWREAGLPELTVAVNLSAAQFRRGDLEQKVSAALDDAGFDPKWLELELTESILINEADSVMGTVRQLQALGVKLSIDDFGTGYSSLAYLKRFNLDKLKIDQSFVRNMMTEPEDRAIVHAIIQLGQAVGLKTIAEGVETEEQLACLKACRCDEAQGYFLGRPMPAAAITAHLAERMVAQTTSS